MTVSHSSTLRIINHYAHVDDNSVDVADQTKRKIYEWAFTNGSGVDQMQDFLTDQRTVQPGTDNADVLDLAGGLTDRYGNTLTFATIKELIIVNLATTSGEDLQFGGSTGATTGALFNDLFGSVDTSVLKIRADFMFLLAGGGTGYPVTGGTADIIVIENLGTAAITYDLFIGGTR